ncbi:hypothetical protein LTS08_002691 [Lithohypha guttulata]|uniref:Major facilitator superfamily (MFS) profile domain-containing protein n=1 Tax=Lithohypha guttulata TaxID=1690604 RepID=A0AAN7YJI0_9EURO|nr:hypothetical protein LTR51_001860 [Lithohypha guttulata]KAK5090408.1 hypothetical protein LTR05_000580 [Lithohypha guttulata]KAK5104798.1 hypothetical protein LTS08_002691 [Lithohypha guttulata]
MDTLERILSRPAAKPYRSRKITTDGDKPFLNDDGYVDFAPDDIENPKNWSKTRRWYISIVSISLVLNATFASSSPSGCLVGIAEEFGVSIIAAGLVITLFLLGYCFGPLFFAPLSEFYGRRWIFYITFVSYLSFNFLCAWAPNFGALLVGRFLTGTFASASLSNTPGVFADLFGVVERGNAMAVFSLITFAGPGTSPAISGFLQLTKDWRWSFYVLLWLGGATLVFLITIPETHAATVLTNKAKRIRRLKIPGYENVQSPIEAQGQTLVQIFKVTLTRPWIILFDPISFLIAIYISVTYTLLYMLFSIYPIVFRQMRGWNSGVSELPLIGTVLGAAIGAGGVFITSRKTARKIEAGEEITPEDRLPLAMIGGIGFAICMFWFGWTANFNSIHWIVPTLAGVFLAASIVLIFVSFLNYLTDTYLIYAASAIAANTVARSAAGASAPLFTNQMFRALGVGGGASLVGGVAVLLAVVPFVFYKYGAGIRKRSRFAPTPKKDEESQEADVDNEEKTSSGEDRASSRNRSASTSSTISDSSVTVQEGGREHESPRHFAEKGKLDDVV